MNSFLLLLEKSRYQVTLTPLLEKAIRRFAKMNHLSIGYNITMRANNNEVEKCIERHVSKIGILMMNNTGFKKTPRVWEKWTNDLSDELMAITGTDFNATIKSIIDHQLWLFKADMQARGRAVHPNKRFVGGVGLATKSDFNTQRLGNAIKESIKTLVAQERVKGFGAGKAGKFGEFSPNWISLMKDFKKYVNRCCPSPEYHRWFVITFSGSNEDDVFAHAATGDEDDVHYKLERFSELKKRRRLVGRDADILSYKTFKSLFDKVDTMEVETPENIEKSLKSLGDEIRVVKMGSDFLIHPRTEQAAQFLGRGTRWCTSAKNDCAFNGYNEHHRLMILIPGGSMKRRVQIALPRNEYDRIEIRDTHDQDFIEDATDVDKFLREYPILVPYLTNRGKVDYDRFFIDPVDQEEDGEEDGWE